MFKRLYTLNTQVQYAFQACFCVCFGLNSTVLYVVSNYETSTLYKA